MATGQQERFTIDELSRAVQEALAEGYDGPANGQIRSVPDLRTIRYYTTLGLIDRPAEMRGRTALYGRRHLLQIVAIKRLQADGYSLGDVQARLAGADDKALKKIANLGVIAAPSEKEREAAPTRRGGAFWSNVAPAETETARGARALPDRASRAEGPGPAKPDHPTSLAVGSLRAPLSADEPALSGVSLGNEGAPYLLFQLHRPLDEEDVTALRNAAAPLLSLLAERGLIAPIRSKGE
jgi:DNA-binding transcriptional MerR regulator